jgi:hypothetical protein
MTLRELKEKQAHVKEAMDYMKSLPSEADVVRLAVQQLLAPPNGTTVGAEGALEVLLDLASAADVANDFHSLGALEPVLEQLQSSSSAQARARSSTRRGSDGDASTRPRFVGVYTLQESRSGSHLTVRARASNIGGAKAAAHALASAQVVPRRTAGAGAGAGDGERTDAQGP